MMKQERLSLTAPWTQARELVDMEKLLELGQMLKNKDADAALEWWWEKLPYKQQKAARFPIDVIRTCSLSGITEVPKLYIGTIHSYKGGEADCVILCPDISVRAYEQYFLGGEDNIIRAFYVALTRAREEVYICQPICNSELAVDISIM